MTQAQCPPYWQQAIDELSANDAMMAKIIAHFPNECIESRKDPFQTLLRSITGQQISVKAAAAIWGRLEEACEHQLAPPIIAALSEETLRACGYSRMKVSYLHSLAEFFLTRSSPEHEWQQMTDEEVVKDVTQIKGIGIWTAEMFLMFHLLRPNLLPLGDVGLLNGVAKHYHGGERRPLPEVAKLAEMWQPWRSVATWYLWRSLDDITVEY